MNIFSKQNIKNYNILNAIQVVKAFFSKGFSGQKRT